MQSTNIIIREAQPADFSALSELMNELGYETTIGEMELRFENIHNHKDYETFFATADAEILGIVGLSKNYSYEQNGIYVRVLAIVTRSNFRQKGVGKKLM